MIAMLRMTRFSSWKAPRRKTLGNHFYVSIEKFGMARTLPTNRFTAARHRDYSKNS